MVMAKRIKIITKTIRGIPQRNFRKWSALSGEPISKAIAFPVIKGNLKLHVRNILRTLRPVSCKLPRNTPAPSLKKPDIIRRIWFKPQNIPLISPSLRNSANCSPQLRFKCIMNTKKSRKVPINKTLAIAKNSTPSKWTQSSNSRTI